MNIQYFHYYNKLTSFFHWLSIPIDFVRTPTWTRTWSFPEDEVCWRRINCRTICRPFRSRLWLRRRCRHSAPIVFSTFCVELSTAKRIWTLSVDCRTKLSHLLSDLLCRTILRTEKMTFWTTLTFILSSIIRPYFVRQLNVPYWVCFNRAKLRRIEIELEFMTQESRRSKTQLASQNLIRNPAFMSKKNR